MPEQENVVNPETTTEEKKEETLETSTDVDTDQVQE